jgi:hypothetical protein
MPALKSVRQERFVQLVRRGVAPYAAYPQAGYRPHESNCYRLSENERVKKRMDELNRALARETRVTVASLTEELSGIARGAIACEQYGAARGAIETIAKLHGLLVERKEVGMPGDFSALSSIEEIVAKVRAELGDGAAELMASAMGEPPKAIEAPIEREVKRIDEASSELIKTLT